MCSWIKKETRKNLNPKHRTLHNFGMISGVTQQNIKGCWLTQDDPRGIQLLTWRRWRTSWIKRMPNALTEKFYYVTWEDCGPITSVPRAGVGRTPREDSVNSEGVTKENIPNKCRPITRLPLMWRLFIGMMSEKKYTVFYMIETSYERSKKGIERKQEELTISCSLTRW